MVNNSTSALSPDAITWHEYIVIGSAAILTNLILIIILLTNTNLLKKSAFIGGLAFGDLLDGVALLGNGVRRIYMNHHGTLTGNVHPFQCMQTFTPVFLMGNQIPGVMFFLIGLERFLAVRYFDWYYVNWKPRLAWIYTGFAYLFCALSLFAAYLVTYLQPKKAVAPIACNTPAVMGRYYITFNYNVSIIGGTVAVVTTVVALIIFTKRKNRVCNTTTAHNISARVRKECRQSRVMFFIAVLDLVLVVVPNILLTLANGFKVIDFSGSWSLQIISSRSVLNLFIYVFMNVEFRVAAWKTFTCKHSAPSTQLFVASSAITQMRNSQLIRETTAV